MQKKMGLGLLLCSVAAIAIVSMTSTSANAGRGNGPIVYVVSQGLFYDSIVTADPLPQHGPFQMLNPNHPNGLATMFGPGDSEYLGGRWWVDVNGNGEMDMDDHYFSCPLLGPGRETP